MASRKKARPRPAHAAVDVRNPWEKAGWSQALQTHVQAQEDAYQRMTRIILEATPLHDKIAVVHVDVPFECDTTAGQLARTSFLPLEPLLALPDAGVQFTGDRGLSAKRAELAAFQKGLADPDARLYLLDGKVRVDSVPTVPSSEMAVRITSNIPAFARRTDDVREDDARQQRGETRLVPASANILFALGQEDTERAAVAGFCGMPEANVRGIMSLGGTDAHVLAHAALLLPPIPGTPTPASLRDAAWVAVPSTHVLRTMCEMGLVDPATNQIDPTSRQRGVLVTVECSADPDEADYDRRAAMQLIVYPAEHVARVLGHAQSFLDSFLPPCLPRATAGFALSLADLEAMDAIAWDALPPETPIAFRTTLALKLALVPSAAHGHLYPTMPQHSSS